MSYYSSSSVRSFQDVEQEIKDCTYKASQIDSDLDLAWSWYELCLDDLAIIKKLSIKAKVAILRSMVFVDVQVHQMCY